MNRRLALRKASFLFLGFLFSILSYAGEKANFEFALLGDTPYNRYEESAFVSLLESLNQEKLPFVVHLGDFKSSAVACSDELFMRRLQQFNNASHPLVYIPGDNEWTDCGAAENSAVPVERLRKLREIFFSDGYSLGRRKIKLNRQNSEFPENVRWRHKDVVFVGLNLPGSNNNYISGAQNQEYEQRQVANAIWLKRAFALARRPKSRGLVILIHANPHFEKEPQQSSGYQKFRADLQHQAEQFKKPILVAHGDTHLFRVDQPLKDKKGNILTHVTRVEVPGSPFTDWVRVKVDVTSPALFVIDGALDYFF